MSLRAQLSEFKAHFALPAISAVASAPSVHK